MSRLLRVLLALILAMAPAACSSGGEQRREGSGELAGTIEIEAGECDNDDRSGSFFRMVQPGGTLEDGPFVTNADSPCQDKTWTPLAPGEDGGLRLGAYQPHPEPAFDGSDGAADAILAPTRFFAVHFAAATNQTDPQTGAAVPAPRLTADADGELGGDLSAFGVAWNQQHFNQGAPKPGGELPGLSRAPSGSYDESSGALTLRWSSQIVGGPFNNFTGVWHLEGTLRDAE